MKRRPRSFLITILNDEVDPDLICGRVQTITTAEEKYFRGMDELHQILRQRSEHRGMDREEKDCPQDLG